MDSSDFHSIDTLHPNITFYVKNPFSCHICLKKTRFFKGVETLYGFDLYSTPREGFDTSSCLKKLEKKAFCLREGDFP